MKPVFQSDRTVSVMELIAAAHSSVPHDEKFIPPAGGVRASAVWDENRHGSLTERATGNKIRH